MQVRAKKRAPQWKGQTPKQQAQPYTFSAPVRGWVLNEALVAVRPGGARILDNWICTSKGARLRGGCTELANVGDPVRTLFRYNGSAEQLFAATDDTIYEASDSGSTAVSGLTGGDFSVVQFGATGGDYLYAVNGADSPRLYDGGTWTAITGASTPAITGVTTTSLSQVWSFASRLFFVEKNSLSAWYLPAASIGGAATEINLSAVFKQGGSLLFGATWSLDGGDGLDDKCVFVTTEGEVAVYEGSDPSSASTWRRSALVRMPKPKGKRGFVQVGGDILIATEGGLVPLSAALRYDLAALEEYAISRAISPYWADEAQRLNAKSWELLKSSDMGCLVVAKPDDGRTDCLLSSLVTGAWSRVTGWDVQCLSSFAGRTYFGSSDGGVYLADEGGTDNGTAYTGKFLGQFEAMGIPGAQKTIRQLRGIFESGTDLSITVGANADYSLNLPLPPAAAAVSSGSVWDVAEWDAAVWDSTGQTQVNSLWTPCGVTGSVIAPYALVSSDSALKPVVEMAAIDAQFSVGAMVT